MEIDFSQLFHQYTKSFKHQIPMDDSLWPEEWKTVYYKKYPRFAKIKLSSKEHKYDLFQALEKRSSQREGMGKEISLNDLSLLLKYSCGITRKSANGDGRRVQPSGGARYPIETYGLLLKPGKGLKPGFFHYDVEEHHLDLFWQEKISQEKLAGIATYEFIKDASLIIFLTAVFWRTQIKYGQRGYRFALIEAGHIGQNIYLLCQALGFKCCALGGFRISDEKIEEMLGVDGVTESLVYALAIG